MLGMVEDAEQLHIGDMKKSPRVTFKMLRIAEGDWQIVAECPGTETQYIKGLKSKEDVDACPPRSSVVAWTKTSFPPPSCPTKPNPLSALYILTEPTHSVVAPTPGCGCEDERGAERPAGVPVT